MPATPYAPKESLADLPIHVGGIELVRCQNLDSAHYESTTKDDQDPLRPVDEGKETDILITTV